jgi:hypothetical protein
MWYNGGGMKSCRLRLTIRQVTTKANAGPNDATRTTTAIFYNACWQLAFNQSQIKF